MYAYIHGSFCVEKLGFLEKEKDRKTSLRSREINLLRRLRRQLPRGGAFQLACFPIRHTWRLYCFYIRAFR